MKRMLAGKDIGKAVCLFFDGGGISYRNQCGHLSRRLKLISLKIQLYQSCEYAQKTLQPTTKILISSTMLLVLFIIAKDQELRKCLSAEEWIIKNVLHLHT